MKIDLASVNRITPEMIMAAYAKTGLRPIRNRMYDDGAACGLGVLCRVREADAVGQQAVSDLLGVSKEYLFGFHVGFDGLDLWSVKDVTPEHEQGLADGRACAAAVFTS